MPKQNNNERYYIKPSVTTDIAVIYDNKILLIKRKNEPYKGCYALPGGFLNPDEDAKTGAIRELCEETGISSELRFLFPVTTPGRDPRGWTITLCYGCKSESKLSLKAGDDAMEAVWFDYMVQDDNDSVILYLIYDNLRLESHLKIVNDNFGDMDFEKTQVVISGGIAFDHSKLIYQAIKKLI